MASMIASHRMDDAPEFSRRADILENQILAFFDFAEDDKYLLMGDVELKFDVTTFRARKALRDLEKRGILQLTKVKQGRALQHRYQRRPEGL